MLLDELKIEQDDLKVGDVVYTSHHPNIVQRCDVKR